MKKWFRWQGLAAFALLSLIIALFWFVFIDRIVASMIEKYGTEIVHAKVELDNADLSLFPMGLKLHGLQVTNPDAPMTNAFQVDRIDMSIEAGHLLRRKVIIDTMEVEGLRFHTERKKSGAVSSKREKETASTKKKLPAFDFSLPDIGSLDAKEILARENLATIALAKELEAEIKATKENWRSQLEDLPDEKTFQGYKSRVENLKQAKSGGVMGIFGAASDLNTLQSEMRQDIDKIKKASTLFDQKQASLKSRIDEITSAPAKDFVRLKEKYTLSPQGLSNLSRLLFGPQIEHYVSTTISWYDRLKPYLQESAGQKSKDAKAEKTRGKGVDVRFAEKEPVPDFLIRKIKASVSLNVGDLQGTLENITTDQNIVGKPLTFKFAGEKLKGVRSVLLNGTLDHISPDIHKDKVTLVLAEYNVNDLPLSKSDSFPMVLKKALADLKLNFDLVNNSLAAKLAGDLKSVQFNEDMADRMKMSFARAVQDALSGVSRFSFQAEASGTLADYTVNLSSDLDGILKNAASGIIKEQSKRFEKDLQNAIQDKVNGPIDQMQNSWLGLADIDKELTERLNLGNDLLSGLKIF